MVLYWYISWNTLEPWAKTTSNYISFMQKHIRFSHSSHWACRRGGFWHAQAGGRSIQPPGIDECEDWRRERWIRREPQEGKPASAGEVYVIWFVITLQIVAIYWTFHHLTHAYVMVSLVVFLLQVKEKIKKFLEAMVQKSGKIRALIREINEHYSGSDMLKRQHSNYPKMQFPSDMMLILITSHIDIRNSPLLSGRKWSWKSSFRNWIPSMTLWMLWWPMGKSWTSHHRF